MLFLLLVKLRSKGWVLSFFFVYFIFPKKKKETLRLITSAQNVFIPRVHKNFFITKCSTTELVVLNICLIIPSTLIAINVLQDNLFQNMKRFLRKASIT